jgi:hypothetical protein
VQANGREASAPEEPPLSGQIIWCFRTDADEIRHPGWIFLDHRQRPRAPRVCLCADLEKEPSPKTVGVRFKAAK